MDWILSKLVSKADPVGIESAAVQLSDRREFAAGAPFGEPQRQVEERLDVPLSHHNAYCIWHADVVPQALQGGEQRLSVSLKRKTDERWGAVGRLSWVSG